MADFAPDGSTWKYPDLGNLPFGYYSSVTTANRAICPDLLSIRDIGEADGWRGKAVRGFFRLLKVVSGV